MNADELRQLKTGMVSELDREIARLLCADNQTVVDEFVVTDGDHLTPIPHYSTDANAALTLVAQIPLGGVSINEDGVTWSATGYVDGAGVIAEAEADTAALAICRAWLAWKRGGSKHESENDDDGL